MASVQYLKDYITQIHATNIVSCNVPQVLDSLDITVSSVPSINLYLFELIQNALDAGADAIQIQVLEDECETAVGIGKRLIFEHNGRGGLGNTDLHVRGMSNVFQSTKSVGSVGFMGFGFKTLYKRFATVHVSDIVGWKFKFEVKEEQINISQFSDLDDIASTSSNSNEMLLSSRNWIGAVTPQWDETISEPSNSFTTRFELKNLVSSTLNHPISGDISEALFSGSLTPLAVLASQGLQSLKIQDLKSLLSFQLSASSSDITVSQLCPSLETHRFLLYETQFTPSAQATKALAQARLKNILKHRDSVQKVLKEIQRPRRVLGIVPLALEDQLPQRQKGQLFACLPIRSFVPFGISLQADWLLDLSRKGLRDISTNAWQQSLLDNVSTIVASFLKSIPSLSSRKEIHRYFSIFGFDDDADKHQGSSKSMGKDGAQIVDSPASTPSTVIHHRHSTNAFALGISFGEAIARVLGSEPVFPVISNTACNEDILTFMSVGKVVYLPTKYDSEKYIGRERLLKLVGFHLLDSSLMPPESIQFFVSLGLIRTLDIGDIIEKFMTEQGMEEWYNTVESTDALRRQALVELWAFLGQFSPLDVVSKLKCMPSIVTRPIQSDSSSDASSLSVPAPLRWNWTSPSDISVFEHESQYFELPEEEAAKQFLNAALGSQGATVLAPSFLPFVLKKSGDWNGPGRIAFEWIAKHWSKKNLKILARRAFMTASFSSTDLDVINPEVFDRFSASNNDVKGQNTGKLSEVLFFTKWAASNGLASLITHVIPSRHHSLEEVGRVKLVEVSLAVLASPYVESGISLIHTRLFSQWPTVHPIYAKIHLDRAKEGANNDISVSSFFTSPWGLVFSKLGSKGKLELEEYVSQELGVYPSYSESRKTVANILEISHDSVLDFQTTSRNGWKIIDTRIKDVSLGDHPELASHIAKWLENNLEALQRADSCLVGQGEVWRTYTAHGRTGTASWCQVLNSMEWVPTISNSGALVRPFQVLRNQVSLSPRLISVLESKGVYFGRTGAQKALLDQVASFDASSISTSDSPSNDNGNTIQSFTEAIRKLAFVDASQHVLVASALQTAIFPILGSSNGSVSFERIIYLPISEPGDDRIDTDTATQNLTLGGFLIPTSELPMDLKNALEDLDRRGIITIPRWPTAASALKFLSHVFHLVNSNPESTKMLYDLVPIAFDYLSQDPVLLRREIKKLVAHLKFPVPPSSTPSSSSEKHTWISITDSAQISAIPCNVLGTNRNVQRFVRSCLFEATASFTNNSLS